MIRINCPDDSFRYDVFSLVQAFYPEENIVFKGDKKDTQSEGSKPVKELDIKIDNSIENRLERKNDLKRLLYYNLTNETKRELPWGTLTGIRPTKLAMRGIREGLSDSEISEMLKTTYLVSEKKSKLGIDIARREYNIISKICDDSWSLYVGIAFCPSICAYCSFSSSPIERYIKRVDDYLLSLLKELSFISKAMEKKKLVSIYIGGGTPTTLSCSQLETLLSFINDRFNLSELLEYTVEAGRPDSIDIDKLRVIKSFGVNRISVNPQTLNQKTLDLIGRRHSTEDVKKAVRLVKKVDFDTLNMDIIIGLPGEDLGDVDYTLKGIKSFNPENLTIHSLAIKRASRLKTEEFDKTENTSVNVMEAMMDRAYEYTNDMGLFPYYLYRQKQISGNLENVGFSLPQKEGIYNILIMEEIHPIIAAGAGGASKYVKIPGLKPERSENVKDIEGYISRIDEMIERKREKLEEI